MRHTRLGGIGLAALMTCAMARAEAGIVYTIDNSSVQATADFTFKTNEIDVVLTNLTIDPKAVSQNISALIFTVVDPIGGASLIEGKGWERTIGPKGTYKPDPGLGPSVDAGWVLSQTSQTLTLDVLSGKGAAGPKHTILGDPGAGGTYASANGSLTNKAHNPFLYGPVSFSLQVAGVTERSMARSVFLQFGTTDGANRYEASSPVANPEAQSIPEPASLALWGGLGLIAAAGAGRRKRAGTATIRSNG